MDTYTNQSIANKRDTSCTGASMALRTTSRSTRAAEGTEADDTLAAVEVNLKIIIHANGYCQLGVLN